MADAETVCHLGEQLKPSWTNKPLGIFSVDQTLVKRLSFVQNNRAGGFRLLAPGSSSTCLLPSLRRPLNGVHRGGWGKGSGWAGCAGGVEWGGVAWGGWLAVGGD